MNDDKKPINGFKVNPSLIKGDKSAPDNSPKPESESVTIPKKTMTVDEVLASIPVSVLDQSELSEPTLSSESEISAFEDIDCTKEPDYEEKNGITESSGDSKAADKPEQTENPKEAVNKKAPVVKAENKSQSKKVMFNDDFPENRRQHRGGTGIIVGMSAVIIAIAIIIGSIAWRNNSGSLIYNGTTNSPQQITELADNPIDFPSLAAINTDIVGWISIPNTSVNYAVCRSGDTEDGFYLNHNMSREYDTLGAIYMEKQNSADFSDYVTLLYGHNTKTGEMFRTLYYFKDADFFNENRYIYVYAPGHIFTYEIFAAYEYDNRHILNCIDMNDTAVRVNYLQECLSPTDTVQQVKKDTVLDGNSKIITLSTCVVGVPSERYIVQGVLVKDEPTK